MKKVYRTDIDGLRAIAVISVILFHLGYIHNGYLGVDIFFVISGYLITNIIYNDEDFSIFNFYERRIRRIIPLVLFTGFVAFIFGIIFMLPDDLENLCQSIIATNFSGNNILMYITSNDYWAIKNDYKPLMHTWSLGIEEQFYLLYPIIFYVLKNNRKKLVFPVLILLTIISLFFFCFSDSASSKFYFIQFRFFELSIGGIYAIYFGVKKNRISFTYRKYVLYFFLTLLIILLWFNIRVSHDNKVLLTIFLTSGILVLGDIHFKNNLLYKFITSNKIISSIGKISFSLYMWHQIVFAFFRYTFSETFTSIQTTLMLTLILILSIFSYYLIENPFRNRSFIKTKPLLITVSLSFIVVTSLSLYVYVIGGVIKDIPELGIKKSEYSKKLNFFDGANNIHNQYNVKIYNLDTSFSKVEKIKVLVVGNSFARDFSNVLLESSFINDIEIRYTDINNKKSDSEIIKRINNADYIFVAKDNYFSKDNLNKLEDDFKIDMKKVWIVGTKNFGNSNGIHYNNLGKIESFDTYYSPVRKSVLETNQKFKNEWGERYIDLLEFVINKDGKVLIFTPNGKFISQDTRHFTKFGALFFANLLDPKLRSLLKLD